MKQKYIWGYYLNPISHCIRVFRVTLLRETEKFYFYRDNDFRVIGWPRTGVQMEGKVSKNNITVATSREELLKKVKEVVAKRKAMLAQWTYNLETSGVKSIKLIEKAVAKEKPIIEPSRSEGDEFVNLAFPPDSPFAKWGSEDVIKPD